MCTIIDRKGLVGNVFLGSFSVFVFSGRKVQREGAGCASFLTFTIVQKGGSYERL